MASHWEVGPLDGSFRHPDGMIVPSGGHGHAIGTPGPRQWVVHREVVHPPDGPADGVANGEHHASNGRGIGEADFLPTDPAMGLALGAPLAYCQCNRFKFELQVKITT